LVKPPISCAAADRFDLVRGERHGDLRSAGVISQGAVAHLHHDMVGFMAGSFANASEALALDAQVPAISPAPNNVSLSPPGGANGTMEARSDDVLQAAASQQTP